MVSLVRESISIHSRGAVRVWVSVGNIPPVLISPRPSCGADIYIRLHAVCDCWKQCGSLGSSVSFITVVCVSVARDPCEGHLATGSTQGIQEYECVPEKVCNVSLLGVGL